MAPSVYSSKGAHSWLMQQPTTAPTGVATGPLAVKIDDPDNRDWAQFAGHTWFAASVGDDWVRIAFHRPVSCAFSPGELPTTSSSGSVLSAILLSIPPFNHLEALVRGRLSTAGLVDHLRSSLAAPIIQGLNLDEFWVFVARYL